MPLKNDPNFFSDFLKECFKGVIICREGSTINSWCASPALPFMAE